MSTNASGDPMLKHAPLGNASPVEVREAESVNGPLAILDSYYGVYVTCPDDAQYRLDWIKDIYTPDMNHKYVFPNVFMSTEDTKRISDLQADISKCINTANYNCTLLDAGKIIIGDNCMLAPNVAIYTAGHPLHPDSRNSGYEYGMDVTIGNNVWIGGSVVITPGVRIGDCCVIGAGSVVTKDIPAWSLAAGNPCRVIRSITEADRKFYFKDREFDETAWEQVRKAGIRETV